MCQKEEEKQQSVQHAPIQVAAMAPQEDAMKGFVPLEAPQQIASVHQDGVNCGCFAAAMAIASLLHVSPAETSLIAHHIQEIAEKNAVSATGELFDADALAAAVNTYCTDKVDQATLDRKLLAKSLDFSSKDQLVQMLLIAKQRGVKALMAYFSDDHAQPTMPSQSTADLGVDGHVLPKEMFRAHWAVVNIQEVQGVQQIVLTEGSQLTDLHTFGVDALYGSNMSLGDSFNWTHFLDDGNTQYRPAVALREAKKQQFTRLRLDMKNPFEGGPEVEKVNLRGKIVFIGHEQVK